MSSQLLKTDTKPAANAADEELIDGVPQTADLGNDEFLAADARLVERCIQGEVTAWEELYLKCHAPLCTSIRIRLGRLGADAQLVDELAARVWYLLVADDGEQLPKYRAYQKSIQTYVRLIARRVIADYFRTERRRLKNEIFSLMHKSSGETAAHADSLPILVGEFLALLTPRERIFCFDYLQISPDDKQMKSDKPYSPANIWQLTRRVYKKFLNYIGPPD